MKPAIPCQLYIIGQKHKITHYEHLLEQAQHVLQLAMAKAMKIDVPVNIVVTDNTGYLKAFVRMDGAVIGSIDIAMQKAKTSMLFGMNSETVGEFLKPAANAYGLENTNGGLLGFAGGMPVRLDGHIVGFIGVSGAPSCKTLPSRRQVRNYKPRLSSFQTSHYDRQKRILITGAGSGFGEGAAIGLAKAGHYVIAGVQISPQVTALRQKAEALGLQNNIQVERLDILDPYDVKYALTGMWTSCSAMPVSAKRARYSRSR